MGKQSNMCLSIVIYTRLDAIRPRYLFVPKKRNIQLCILLFYVTLGGKVGVDKKHGIGRTKSFVCLNFTPYNHPAEYQLCC